MNFLGRSAAAAAAAAAKNPEILTRLSNQVSLSLEGAEEEAGGKRGWRIEGGAA